MITSISGLFRKILKPTRGIIRFATTPAIEDENLCFLISAPRSGSTWAKKALNQHPNVYCTEQRLFGNFFEVWIDDIATGKQSMRITLDAYVDTLAGSFDYQSLNIDRQQFKQQMLVAFAQTLIAFGREKFKKGVVVDKITPYLDTSPTVIESIRTYFPNAKLIYLLRDGRDVATSGVFDWLKKTTQDGKFTEFQIQRYQKFTQQDAAIHLDHFFEPEEIKIWTAYWCEPLQHIHSHAGLTISYEQMKQDQGRELRRIFRYLSVPDDDAIIERCVQASSFQQMSGGRSLGEEVPTAKVRKGIVGDWKSYFTKQNGELFHRLAGKYLIALGYEKDENWYKKLPERLDL